MRERAKIKYIPTCELKPHENNTRVHPPEQIQAIAASIVEYGFIRPVLVDAENRIIGGHGCVEAAKLAKITEVPCICVEHFTKEQIRGYMIADNRLAEMSYFDMSALEQELTALNELGVDVALTGFDFEEVKKEADRLERKLRLKNSPPSELKDTFIIPPFSVLDTRQGYWQGRKRQWLDYGIKSEVGRDENLVFAESLKLSENDNGTSIFDPVLCEIMYRWFNVPEGMIFDPFAGGSVRGIVAKNGGYKYLGIDLRPEQVESNRENAIELGLSDEAPQWVCDDSLNMDRHIDNETADMVFTCPPYYDLEVYSDDPCDISNMSYDDFTETFNKIMSQAAKKLKENRFMVVVLSDVRSTDGCYRGIVNNLSANMKSQGLSLYNDMILLNVAGSAALRVRRSMRNRKVARMHQNVLVYYKGDTKMIKTEFPELTEITDDILEE